MSVEKTFADDLKFLEECLGKNTGVVLLADADSRAKVVVAPGLQGRIVTSTTDGVSSFGWVNYSLIQSGEKQKHINAFGGEDRFWIGPDSGQFSVFNQPGDTFDGDHYQAPDPLDWGCWDVVSSSRERLEMRKAFTIGNASGRVFELTASRVVRIYKQSEITDILGMGKIPAGVDTVGFESFNTIVNDGEPFDKKTGLVSLWMLGMMQATPSAVVVVPFKTTGNPDARDVVNADYFGRVPDDRLKVDLGRGVAFFRGDSRKSSKIGIAPKFAKDTFGYWRPELGALTVIKFSLPPNAEQCDYVNSMWEVQKEPYKGDVINSYNDGPNPSGEQLGEFCELETSSPALTLGRGQKQTHTHRTFHFTGDKRQLNEISRTLLGVGIEEIEGAL